MADANLLQSYPFLFYAILFLLVAIIVYLFYLQSKSKKEIGEVNNQLEKMQDRLVESEKLAALGTLTTGIAHEIKNPLNFVNNFAGISIDLHKEFMAATDVAEQKELSQILIENLEKINTYGKRADSIVNTMMLIGSDNSNKQRVKVNFNELVDDYLNMAFHNAENAFANLNCTVERNFSTNLPAVTLVPHQIGKVLLNVFDNSFYALSMKQKHDGSSFQPKMMLHTIVIKNNIILKITDNGIGIPDAVKPKIFEPFFSTKSASDGVGLGLSQSHEIVEIMHQGKLAVSTIPNEFTCMEITLPVL